MFDMDGKQTLPRYLRGVRESPITSLAQTLERLASCGGYARYWTGPAPEPEPSMIAAIAAKVGLQASGREPDFANLSAANVELWLSLFAGGSMLHPGAGSIAPVDVREELASALSVFKPDALFVSKGRWEFTRRGKLYEPVFDDGIWEKRRNRLWYRQQGDPLPPIEVISDGGIIGYDSDIAFIFWAEEDD